MSFPHRHVWIVGASSGMGAELARLLAADGCRVAVSARSAGPLEELAEEAASGPGDIGPFPLDATDPEALAKAFAEIESAGGPVDLLVLSAATYKEMTAQKFDLDVFRQHMEINVMGVANALAAVMPAMLSRGKGKISVIASVAGYRGLPLAIAYGPTKAALNNLCEALRFDLEPAGVAVQVINPGFVETPLTDQNEFEMPHLMPVDKAAKKLMNGLASRRFEVTFPWQFTLQLKLIRILPRAVAHWLIKRATKRR